MSVCSLVEYWPVLVFFGAPAIFITSNKIWPNWRGEFEIELRARQLINGGPFLRHFPGKLERRIPPAPPRPRARPRVPCPPARAARVIRFHETRAPVRGSAQERFQLVAKPPRHVRVFRRIFREQMNGQNVRHADLLRFLRRRSIFFNRNRRVAQMAPRREKSIRRCCMSGSMRLCAIMKVEQSCRASVTPYAICSTLTSNLRLWPVFSIFSFSVFTAGIPPVPPQPPRGPPASPRNSPCGAQRENAMPTNRASRTSSPVVSVSKQNDFNPFNVRINFARSDAVLTR